MISEVCITKLEKKGSCKQCQKMTGEWIVEVRYESGALHAVRFCSKCLSGIRVTASGIHQ